MDDNFPNPERDLNIPVYKTNRSPHYFNPK